MPIRELIYFVNLISRLIKEKKINVYGSTKAILPTPQFIVFYNGLTKQPERRKFRLSDSFEGIEGEPPLELVCEAIQQGIHQGVTQIVCNMLEKGMEPETIADICKISIEEVMQIQKDNM